MKKKNQQNGFTLMELLIVMALLGFLSVLGLSMFQGSQRRSRDIRRKNDLVQIAKALEMYANDYGYPASDAQGRIVGCGGTPATVCEWGSAWTRGSTYMQRLPKDSADISYCYEQDPNLGKWYKLYAKLESTDDPTYDDLLTCGGRSYTYVLLSPNITPTPTLEP